MKIVGGILTAILLALATMASASVVLASDTQEDMIRESQEDVEAYRLARWYLKQQEPILAVDVRAHRTIIYRYMHSEAYEYHVNFVERLVSIRWKLAKLQAKHKVKLW